MPKAPAYPTLSTPPAASDPNFWNFVAVAIMTMFIIFITAKGELETYIQLFFYSPPSPAKPAASGASSSQAPASGASAPAASDAPQGFFGYLGSGLWNGLSWIGKLGLPSSATGTGK